MPRSSLSSPFCPIHKSAKEHGCRRIRAKIKIDFRLVPNDGARLPIVISVDGRYTGLGMMSLGSHVSYGARIGHREFGHLVVRRNGPLEVVVFLAGNE